MEQEKEKESTGKEEGVQIAQVVTETQEVFSVNGETMTINQYLAWIGNEIIKIRKGVSG